MVNRVDPFCSLESENNRRCDVGLNGNFSTILIKFPITHIDNEAFHKTFSAPIRSELFLD